MTPPAMRAMSRAQAGARVARLAGHEVIAKGEASSPSEAPGVFGCGHRADGIRAADHRRARWRRRLGVMRRHWQARSSPPSRPLLVVVVAAGYLWLSDLAEPMPETEAAMVSAERGHRRDRAVADLHARATRPRPASSSTPVAACRRRPTRHPFAPIAEAGYLGVIAPMPFGLAVLDARCGRRRHRGAPRDRTLGHRRPFAGRRDGGAVCSRPRRDRWPGACGRPTRRRAPTSRTATCWSPRSTPARTAWPRSTRSRPRRPSCQRTRRSWRSSGGNHAGFGWYGDAGRRWRGHHHARGSSKRRWWRSTLELIEAVARWANCRLGRMVSLSASCTEPRLSSKISTSKRCSPGLSA